MLKLGKKGLEKLRNLPETGMGYQVVTITLRTVKYFLRPLSIRDMSPVFAAWIRSSLANLTSPKFVSRMRSGIGCGTRRTAVAQAISN